jgi:hypothetical protein
MRELAARSAEARERALSRCQLLEPHLEGEGSCVWSRWIRSVLPHVAAANRPSAHGCDK